VLTSGIDVTQGDDPQPGFARALDVATVIRVQRAWRPSGFQIERKLASQATTYLASEVRHVGCLRGEATENEIPYCVFAAETFDAVSEALRVLDCRKRGNLKRGREPAALKETDATSKQTVVLPQHE
jgi:hypothetical protein